MTASEGLIEENLEAAGSPRPLSFEIKEVVDFPMAEDFGEDYRPWEELPPNALVTIFKKLCIEDRFCGGPVVCRSWREASKNPQCWVSMLHDDIDQSEIDDVFIKKRDIFWKDDFYKPYRIYGSSQTRRISDDGLRMFVERSNGNATTIFIPCQCHRKKDLSFFIAQRCPKLKNLSARWCKLHEKELQGLTDLLNSCKQLEILDLGHFYHLLTSDTATLECCPKLRGLRVSSYTGTRVGPIELGINSKECEGIFFCFKNLELLNLQGCLQLNNLDNILDQLKNLKYLGITDVSSLKIDSDELAEKYKRIPEVKVDINDYSFTDEEDMGVGAGDGDGDEESDDDDDYELEVEEQVDKSLEEEREKWILLAEREKEILLEEKEKLIIEKKAELEEKQRLYKTGKDELGDRFMLFKVELEEIRRLFRAENNEKNRLYLTEIDGRGQLYVAELKERSRLFIADMAGRSVLYMAVMDKFDWLYTTEIDKKNRLFQDDMAERYWLFLAERDERHWLIRVKMDERERFIRVEKDKRRKLHRTEKDEKNGLFDTEEDERYRLFEAENVERHRLLTAENDEKFKLHRAEKEELSRLHNAEKKERFTTHRAEDDERDKLFNVQEDERYKLFKAESDERNRLFNANMKERSVLFNAEMDERCSTFFLIEEAEKKLRWIREAEEDILERQELIQGMEEELNNLMDLMEEDLCS